MHVHVFGHRAFMHGFVYMLCVFKCMYVARVQQSNGVSLSLIPDNQSFGWPTKTSFFSLLSPGPI